LDESGVWGDWSPAFRFRCHAPGVPVDVRLKEDRDSRGWTLTWKPNPQGRPPAAYKVYGSDERGFTASDVAYPVFRGKGFVASMDQYENKPADAPDAGLVTVPANLIARTDKTQLRVIGPAVSLPNTNRAYYRVVAVDAAGNESGASDYAAAPRPYVYTEPPAARAGQPYEYRPGVIRSIGDLRCRRSPASSYNAAFWNREVLSFRAVRLPAELALDADTGVIQGTIGRAGSHEIAFQVATDTGKQVRVEQTLRVEP
jgi:hypothetical protein